MIRIKKEDKTAMGILNDAFFWASGALMFTIFIFATFIYDETSADSQEMEINSYRVSENMPEGIVINEPEDLGGGIYFIHVQMDKSNHDRPPVYSAITAQPENFSVYSKARLKNVTARGQNASSDMFHVAIKP